MYIHKGTVTISPSKYDEISTIYEGDSLFENSSVRSGASSKRTIMHDIPIAGRLSLDDVDNHTHHHTSKSNY